MLDVDGRNGGGHMVVVLEHLASTRDGQRCGWGSWGVGAAVIFSAGAVVLVEPFNELRVKKLLPLGRPPRRDRHRATIGQLGLPPLRQELEAIDQVLPFQPAPQRPSFEFHVKVPVASGLIKDEARQLVPVHPAKHLHASDNGIGERLERQGGLEQLERLERPKHPRQRTLCV